MNGEDSTKETFKTQPKLIVYNYQGSLTNTSEGIKKVFDNARKGIVKYKPNLQLIIKIKIIKMFKIKIFKLFKIKIFKIKIIKIN